MTKLHMTLKHTGKMNGMQSLSTSCVMNENCAKYAKVKGSVCEKCYAQRMTKMYKNLAPCLQKNTEILTKSVLPEEELPEINSVYFRFEAFGDLNNTTQVINYFNICKKNPETKFALWTKNPHLIIPVADQKPENLQILLSSLFLNNVADAANYPFIDKIFTVYDKETIEREGIEINCGARNCFKCHKCYVAGGDKYVNERLK